MPVLLAEIDWTDVLKTVGVAFGGAVGILGGWYLKILSAKWAHDQLMAKQAAELEMARATATALAKRDTIGEYQRLLDIRESDCNLWRDMVHTQRNEQAVTNNRLAICEWDRNRLRQMIEDQETALAGRGIKVHYRPAPDPPPQEIVPPKTPSGSPEPPAGADL